MLKTQNTETLRFLFRAPKIAAICLAILSAIFLRFLRQNSPFYTLRFEDAAALLRLRFFGTRLRQLDFNFLELITNVVKPPRGVKDEHGLERLRCAAGLWGKVQVAWGRSHCHHRWLPLFAAKKQPLPFSMRNIYYKHSVLTLHGKGKILTEGISLKFWRELRTLKTLKSTSTATESQRIHQIWRQYW